ncbi:MAG: class I SAM-dependent methyltransferase [Bdellovibrionales bacterium]
MKPFDKYWYYRDAVQAPDVDARFMFNLYRRLRGRKPKVLHEDFCGTFANLCEWVKINPQTKGIGIDLDPEPLAYGCEHYLPRLTTAQQKRLKLLQANVLTARPGLADVVLALNFSYYIFKTRKELLNYFRHAYAGLSGRGIFVVDAFGGPACAEANVDRTRKRGYTYFWEQVNFEPITNLAKFQIHFKRDGEKIRKKVFCYDWRMWSLPEIREAMLDAGFRKTAVYWEDDHGDFRPGTKGDADCTAWIAYVVGLR